MPDDILGAAALPCSLDGLVAAARAVTGFSEHRAVEHLCSGGTAALFQIRGAEALRRASEAARHPLGEHHAAFLASLDDDPALLNTLSCFAPEPEKKPTIVTSSPSLASQNYRGSSEPGARRYPSQPPPPQQMQTTPPLS